MSEQAFRIIFHIDLNAFFASCEMMEKPELETKPVVVAGPKNFKRGVVTTANYVARKYGIHSGMSVHQARKKCLNLVVLPGNMELYKRVSRSFIDIVKNYSHLIEQASIDEVYLDVTHHFPAWDPLELAGHIQQRVSLELKIGCSIGIAPNKFLAKMASDMKKPNGITILRKRDMKELLWPLPVEKMHGAGKTSAPKLKMLDIHTIGDLANTTEPQKIEQFFGTHGLEWIQKANGKDMRPVDPSRYEIPASIGHSTTFPKDYCFEEEIKDQLNYLCIRTENRLKRFGLFGKTVTLQVKYFDFKQINRSKSLEIPIQTVTELFPIIEELFDEHWNGDPVRLVGVSATNLVSRKKPSKELKQLTLFNYQSFESESKLNRTLSEINKKHQLKIIQRGLKKENKGDKL